MKIKAGTIIAAAVVIAFCGYTGYRYWEASQKKEKQEAGNRKNVTTVNVVVAETRTFLDVRRFSGTIFPWSMVDVEPKVDGRLLELFYDIGDSVKKGSVIAKIDDVEFRQQQRQAQANLIYARAKLRESQVLLDLKKHEFDRHSKLMDKNAVSQAAYEQAKTDLDSRQATMEMCAADVERYQALLDNADVKLSYATIKADWNDDADVRHIGQRYVDEGTLMSVGKPIVSLVEITRVKAYVQIIEQDYPFVHVGQRAEITVDAYPDRVFEGMISNINNTLSEKTRSATAVISIDNKDLTIRPGMFVRVKLLLAEHKNAQSLPLNAVVQEQDKKIVYTYANGKAHRVEVQTGLEDGKYVEILSPELNAPVVTVGNHLLKDGKEIKISAMSRDQIIENVGSVGKTVVKAE